MEKKKISYQNGNVYSHVDNTEFISNEEYKGEVITERVFNSATESYEYVTKIVNAKLDWENQLELLKNIEEIGEVK